MSKYYIINISIIILFLLESCNPVEPGESTRIDSVIKFKIIELYQGDNNNICEPKIYLNLYSEKIYPCLGYEFNIKKNISGKNIDINILNINIPSGCADALGPAHSSLPLDLPIGEYNLKITANRNSDSYLINISDSEIIVHSNYSKISVPIYNKYFRYPSHSFTYHCGTLIEDKYICEDFLDTLKSKINVREYNFPEDGQKPYPDSLGGHYYEMPGQYFLYDGEEEYDKIGEILSNYKKSVIKDKEGIGISITNWQNKSFYSWLY